MAVSESDRQKLYKVLMSDTYRKGHYDWDDLGEGMESISFSAWGVVETALSS